MKRLFILTLALTCCLALLAAFATAENGESVYTGEWSLTGMYYDGEFYTILKIKA